VPLFPIVQDQWLNIFLLNEFEFSYYSVLYYLSGFLFPIVVITNSLSNFFDYKFNFNKYQSKKINFLGCIVIVTILTLSILIISYFIFSVNYIIPQAGLNIYSNIKLKILLLLLLLLLLLINKTKRIIKRFLLINYFIVCFVNWSIYFFKLQGIDIFFSKYTTNISYYEFNNINILNILYLFAFEIFYYLWSYISFQNNLSDWSLSYPKRIDLVPISKISIFYLGVLIYYLIFKRIS
tara:strand:+ start:107 stop:817 length:711 start_codon:yes stop_codon:yes gene_type:complete